MAKAKFQPENTTEEWQLLLTRGTQLLQRGQAQEAVALLERAVILADGNPDILLNLSGAYILTKKFKKAVEILEPLSALEPENVMIWTNLGAAYLGNPILALDEEQQQAIAAFERAVEINPAAPHVAYNIGLIYRDRKEYETAVSWFHRALQANPHDQDARNLIDRLQAQQVEEEE
ncbi:MAG: tetratricopeptide repeat protein [Chloroflexota bacterium]